jgi:hypothetical protein
MNWSRRFDAPIKTPDGKTLRTLKDAAEPADEMEQKLSAGLGKWQVAEFVEDDEVHPGQMLGDTTLPCVAGLDLETIDEVDDVVEPPRVGGAGTQLTESRVAYRRAS